MKRSQDMNSKEIPEVKKRGLKDALKDSAETALNMAGLPVVRAAVSGVTSLYERSQRVKQEIETGERKEGFMKEMFVNGFKETWQKLSMQEGETLGDRLTNAIDAVNSLVNMGRLGAGAAEHSGDSLSSSVDTALDGLELRLAA